MLTSMRRVPGENIAFVLKCWNINWRDVQTKNVVKVKIGNKYVCPEYSLNLHYAIDSYYVLVDIAIIVVDKGLFCRNNTTR